MRINPERTWIDLTDTCYLSVRHNLVTILLQRKHPGVDAAMNVNATNLRNYLNNNILPDWTNDPIKKFWVLGTAGRCRMNRSGWDELLRVADVRFVETELRLMKRRATMW